MANINFIKRIFALTFFSLVSFNQLFAQEEYTQQASIYAIGRYGKKMENGDYLSSRHRTCSHEFLPVGSLIEITNMVNKRVEVVEVNGKSKTTSIELTHSVAHDLGLTGTDRPNMKVLVIKRAEENITYPTTQQHPTTGNKKIIYGSQTTTGMVPAFENPEPKIERMEKKKKNEFSMDFPQYEPIKFDSTSKKILIDRKLIVPVKGKPVFKEKIIMN